MTRYQEVQNLLSEYKRAHREKIVLELIPAAYGGVLYDKKSKEFEEWESCLLNELKYLLQVELEYNLFGK